MPAAVCGILDAAIEPSSPDQYGARRGGGPVTCRFRIRVVAAGTRHVPGGWDDVDTGLGRRNAVSTSTAREAPRGREQGGRVAAGPATSGMSEDPALTWHE
ncbi:hypothetical protein FB384_000024 [Prauserella sediminis]|uniref:Uncharacterized protein n=1 Tax=Prauserella sediminis TaxID=577680 RepID=A0A839XCY2_9PSEU|nr:hypothetical protein [Prauserella sediminis]